MLFTISLITLIALLIGFYMAWNIGANDVANSMATAVGSRAITVRQAVVIAAVLEAAGAILVGSMVAETVRSGVVSPDDFSTEIFIMGSLSAILAASLWITLATWKEMPISTTHSIIGALIGFGVVANGPGAVDWTRVMQIGASWVLSPVVAGILSYIIFRIIVKFIFNKEDPEKAARILGPIFLFATLMLIVSSALMKTPMGDRIGLEGRDGTALLISTLLSFIGSAIGYKLIVAPKIGKAAETGDDYAAVEAVFRRLQIFTSCYVAFAHGANDVANAIGPVAGVIQASQGTMDTHVAIPLYLLLLGGVGIAVGLLTWGYKVMKTIGFKITTLTNTRGFSVDFGAATTVLLASKLGMPVSTTHAVVGAVLGVGLARGLGAVDLKVIKKIVMSWLITLPIAAFTTAMIFLLARMVF